MALKWGSIYLKEIPFLTKYAASIVFTLRMLKQYRHFNFP